MSEWIPTETSKPPESHSVLLYVCFYMEDGARLVDEQIIVGFYGDQDWDETGFYSDNISDGYGMEYKFINENSNLKVIAWTLLPRKPYNPKFTREEWSW